VSTYFRNISENEARNNGSPDPARTVAVKSQTERAEITTGPNLRHGSTSAIGVVVVVDTDPLIGKTSMNVQVMNRKLGVGGEEVEKMRRAAKEVLKSDSGVDIVPSYFKSCHHIRHCLQGLSQRQRKHPAEKHQCRSFARLSVLE
jgi:hypothetical protein